jgi:hypothetical protein
MISERRAAERLQAFADVPLPLRERSRIVLAIAVLLFVVVATDLVTRLFWARPAGSVTPDELIGRLTLALILVSLFVPWLVLALASVFFTGWPIGLGAAVIVAYDLYAYGRIAQDIGGLSTRLGLGPEAQAFTLAIAVQALGLSVLICLVVMVLRGSWPIFVATTGAVAAVLAIGVAGSQTLESSPAKAATVTQVQVVGRYVGTRPPAKDDKVSVVFLVSKVDDKGNVTGLEPKTHAATVAVSDCREKRQRCELQVLVKTGDGDADIASWLADEAAANGRITIVVDPDDDSSS